MAEFAANNNESAFIKFFLFFYTKNLYLYISFNIKELSNTSTYQQIFKQKTLNTSENMQTT